MFKKYSTRILIMISLCLFSLLLKSEHKVCTTECILSETDMGVIQPNIKVESVNNEPLTYYGFYSKF